jgi:hypothetical protein
VHRIVKTRRRSEDGMIPSLSATLVHRRLALRRSRESVAKRVPVGPQNLRRSWFGAVEGQFLGDVFVDVAQDGSDETRASFVPRGSAIANERASRSWMHRHVTTRSRQTREQSGHKCRAGFGLILECMFKNNDSIAVALQDW